MEIQQYFFDNHEYSRFRQNWQLSFKGQPIDERGDFAAKILSENSHTEMQVGYNHATFEINLNGEYSLFEEDMVINPEMSGSIIEKGAVLDLTTLGFVEILYILRSFRNASINIDAIYLEPASYKKFDSEIPTMQKQYDLSSIVNDYSAIPGFTVVDELYSSMDYLFLTGYEANRVEAAFEYREQIAGQNSNIIFGVPAYRAGWETNSLFNNISIIDSERISGSIGFSGATDVKYTFNQIGRIVDALAEDANLCILPLANKPMSLAAALSLIQRKDKTSLLYDHPRNLPSRSRSTSRLHHYRITWQK